MLTHHPLTYLWQSGSKKLLIYSSYSPAVLIHDNFRPSYSPGLCFFFGLHLLIYHIFTWCIIQYNYHELPAAKICNSLPKQHGTNEVGTEYHQQTLKETNWHTYAELLCKHFIKPQSCIKYYSMKKQDNVNMRY